MSCAWALGPLTASFTCALMSGLDFCAADDDPAAPSPTEPDELVLPPVEPCTLWSEPLLVLAREELPEPPPPAVPEAVPPAMLLFAAIACGWSCCCMECWRLLASGGGAWSCRGT